jgi:FAD:protein FMN transferase
MPLVLARAAMGTRFELVLPGLDEPRERAAGEAALDLVEEWEARLSLFRRDSLVSELNREAGRRAVRVDPQTFELLTACAAVWRESEGAFDAALGSDMAAHGFRGDAPGPRNGSRPRAGFAAVELDPATCRVRFTAPGVQLDLGGIAKGFALDRAAEVLREAGIENALLHGGTSTVVALGAPPGKDGWGVAIGREADAQVVQLRDQALSVSGLHGRRNEDGAGHVLDPRTGEPLHGEGAVAVVASNGTLADAWSTALLAARAPRTVSDHVIACWWIPPGSPVVPVGAEYGARAIILPAHSRGFRRGCAQGE